MVERKSKSTTISRPEPSPSNAAVAEALQAAFPKVFQTKIAAKTIVDAVIQEMADIVVREGALVLRGLATIRVVGEEDPGSSKRRRLVLRTSWAMLSKLNPAYPKVRNRGVKGVSRG